MVIKIYRSKNASNLPVLLAERYGMATYTAEVEGSSPTESTSAHVKIE
jgi:hypothetical protein